MRGVCVAVDVLCEEAGDGRADREINQNGRGINTLSSTLRQAGANRARRRREIHLETNVVAQPYVEPHGAMAISR